MSERCVVSGTSKTQPRPPCDALSLERCTRPGLALPCRTRRSGMSAPRRRSVVMFIISAVKRMQRASLHHHEAQAHPHCWIWPQLTPPPASHMEKAAVFGRGRSCLPCWVRPNSPPQMTMSSSSLVASGRSNQYGPIGFTSILHGGHRLLCWSQLMWFTTTQRTPRSTSRRASRHFCP